MTLEDLAQTPLFNRVTDAIKNTNSVLEFYAFLVKNFPGKRFLIFLTLGT